jgi:uncharacterized protein YlxP (DUF503 family)
MTIGVYTIELHLPVARSLKEKRQVFRRLKDRLRSRYNVAVAESADHADLWQRGGLTIVSVAQNRDALVRLFDAIFRETENGIPGQIIERNSEFIEATDPQLAHWFEDEP